MEETLHLALTDPNADQWAVEFQSPQDEIRFLKNENERLARMVTYATEAFTQRDAIQRSRIEFLEAQAMQMAQTLSWFRGAHTPSMVGDMPDKPQ